MPIAYYDKPFSPDLLAGALRAAVRIPLTLAAVLLTFLVFIPLRAVQGPSRRRRSRAAFQKFLMSLLLRILGVRIVRRGTPPREQSCFVANHLGVIDVFAVMAETGARLIAKESLSRIPLFGTFMRLFGVIFIRRDSLGDMHRVVGEMKTAWEEGDSLAFFPEGTTSRGQGIRAFLGALFFPAVQTGAPVHYGTIRFEVPSRRWPLASVCACQVGGVNFIGHLVLLAFLPRTEVHITYGERPLTGLKRKALVGELESRMVRQFEPMEQLPPDALSRLFPPAAQESLKLKARPFLDGGR